MDSFAAGGPKERFARRESADLRRTDFNRRLRLDLSELDAFEDDFGACRFRSGRRRRGLGGVPASAADYKPRESRIEEERGEEALRPLSMNVITFRS
jgi:hypothetical protein